MTTVLENAAPRQGCLFEMAELEAFSQSQVASDSVDLFNQATNTIPTADKASADKSSADKSSAHKPSADKAPTDKVAAHEQTADATKALESLACATSTASMEAADAAQEMAVADTLARALRGRSISAGERQLVEVELGLLPGLMVGSQVSNRTAIGWAEGSARSDWREPIRAAQEMPQRCERTLELDLAAPTDASMPNRLPRYAGISASVRKRYKKELGNAICGHLIASLRAQIEGERPSQPLN